MEQNNNEKNSGGFLFGFLLGMAAALMFTTKRGRKILKKFADQGWDKLGDWEEVLKEVLNNEDFIDGDDYVVNQEVPSEEDSASRSSEKPEDLRILTNEAKDDSGIQSANTATKVKSTARRLFKGIPKRN